MALESGASWPRYMRQLKKSATNVQAVVQTPGEPAEQFAIRALERWQSVLGTSARPHRFVLGANEHWDTLTSSARQRLARAAMGGSRSPGADEVILWGGNIDNVEGQGRLLALAGALVEGQKGQRMVRVLFKEPDPLMDLSAVPNSEQTRMQVA